MAEQPWDGDLSNPERLALRVARFLASSAGWRARWAIEREVFGDMPNAARAAKSAIAWLKRRGCVSRSGKSWALSEAGRAWLKTMRGAA